MPHFCTLQNVNKAILPPLPPNASIFQRFCRFFRHSTLVSHWNPRCKMYFRSSGAIAMERRRHIKSNYLYIIHPFSVFRIIWENWMLLVFFLSLIFLPLDIIINIEDIPFGGISPFVTCLDIACLIDIVVTFFTGYGNEYTKQVILEPKKIAKNYVMHSMFFLDLLSSIPASFVAWIMVSLPKGTFLTKIIQCMSLIKIVRLRTLLIYLSRTGDLFGVSLFAIRILRYCILTFITIHWIGCIHYIIPILAIYIGKQITYKEWIYEGDTLDSKFSIYVNCVFRACAFMLGVERDYRMIEVIDILLGISTFVLGWVLRALIYVLILQMMLSKNSPETKYQQIMTELQQYMRHKKLPVQLQNRLVQYYDYRFQKTYFKESMILHTLSSIINREINLHTYRKLVKNVFILVNLPHHLVAEILANLVLEVFLPNDVIVKAGTSGDCMYFLSCGTVCVLTPSGKEVCHLEEGSYFGEIALISKDQKRTADVIAIEICQIYRLDRKAFTSCIATHADVYDRIQNLADIRKEQTKLVEEIHKKFIMERLTTKGKTA